MEGGGTLTASKKEGGCLWQRETMKAFLYSGAVAKIVPEERWGCHKCLVYDGQQRLQTLYSVLYHRFNGRVLYYDLLFKQGDNMEETGFFFKNPQDPSNDCSVSMIEISNIGPDVSKRLLRNRFLANGELSDEQKALIEDNIDKLWSVFVETDKKSLAFFPVRAETSNEVDEVFRRLNTGGVQLTQLELVLSKVKAESTYYEEELWELTNSIKEATGNGIEFTAFEIMQLIYLLVFKTTRVDESRVNNQNIHELVDMLESVKVVLPHFFKSFFFEGFHINAKWLILRQQAVLPMLVYCVTLYRNNYKWELYKIDTQAMRTYFIKSQLCDWNTQTMVTAFSRLAADAAASGLPFPLDEITQIAIDKNRTSEVSYYQFEGSKWFSLKILTPKRLYLFNERTPQIDHIFPRGLLQGGEESAEYAEKVDVLWNMQPTPAGVNRQKWNTHPVEYFSSPEGRPSLNSYDYLPASLDSEEWKNVDDFIAFRKQKMVDFMRTEYSIALQDNFVSEE